MPTFMLATFALIMLMFITFTIAFITIFAAFTIAIFSTFAFNF